MTESAGGAAPGPAEFTALDDQAARSRIDTSYTALHELADIGAADPASARALAGVVVAYGMDAFQDVSQGNDDALRTHPARTLALEAIVRTDGTRPSFLVVDGEPDLSTVPAGDWADPLTHRRDAVRAAIASVGRIDAGGYHWGTGFLVQSDVVVTNRHVLQKIGRPDADGAWSLDSDATIDFGYEGGTSHDPSRRRAIRSVLFAPAETVADPIDHGVLDVALLHLAEPVEAAPLALSADISWGRGDEPVYLVGYPGDPGFRTYPETVIERTFSHPATFGRKRLAPGMTMALPGTVPSWTTAHDATTLGGSSGSPVLHLRGDSVVAAIHYAGRPRGTNWAHVLSRTFATSDVPTGRTLREVLHDHDVLVHRP